MKNFMDNFLPISVTVFLIIIISLYFYAQGKIPQDTKDFVARFEMAQKGLDFKDLETMYADGATIDIEYIKSDGTSQKSYIIDAQQFIGLAKTTKATKIQLNDYSEYHDAEYKWLENEVQISSVRYSHLTKKKTPHLLILGQTKSMVSQGRPKKWLIVKEYIVEYSSH